MLNKKIQLFKNLIFGKPIMAVFEVNLVCNSKCGYCDLPLNQGRYELSREEIKTIFTHLHEEGLRIIFLQGGEPTLRKDLSDIIKDLYEIGFHLTLITNGTRLRPEFIKVISQYKVSISISLDTLDRERYKRIRGADQLKLVLNGIDNLKDYPHPKYITSIVSEVNQNDILDVVNFSIQKKFIPVVGAYHWDIDRYGKIDNELQYQKEVVANVFQKVIDSELVPTGYFRDYLHDNIAWLNNDSLPACDAGRYSISIDASGNVAPCLALNHAGNLREKSLSDILQNFDKHAIESCSDKSSCNMMCSRVIGSNLRRPFSAIKTIKNLNQNWSTS